MSCFTFASFLTVQISCSSPAIPMFSRFNIIKLFNFHYDKRYMHALIRSMNDFSALYMTLCYVFQNPINVHEKHTRCNIEITLEFLERNG